MSTNEKQYYIYIRSLKERVPVTKEEFDNYYRGINAYRQKEQYHKRCVCPKAKFSYTSDLIYSSSSAGSMAADIPAGGHIPAAFELTYKGAVINPKISLVGSSSNTT